MGCECHAFELWGCVSVTYFTGLDVRMSLVLFQNPGSLILVPGVWDLDPGLWILNPVSTIQAPRFRILNLRSRILHPGPGLDPGSSILYPDSRTLLQVSLNYSIQACCCHLICQRTAAYVTYSNIHSILTYSLGPTLILAYAVCKLFKIGMKIMRAFQITSSSYSCCIIFTFWSLGPTFNRQNGGKGRARVWPAAILAPGARTPT